MSYLGRSGKLSLKAQEKVSFLATAGQTVKTGLSYVPNFIEVYVNGILLTDTTDFTATNGSSVTFTVALALNDEVTVISLKTFSVADHYTKTEDDALLAAKATTTALATTNTAVALKAPIASPSFTGNGVLTGANSADLLIKAPTDNATLTLQAGSTDSGAETSFVKFVQNTNSKWQLGMNTDNSFRLYSYNASAEVFKVDPTGIVTKPLQVFFYASGNATGTQVTNAVMPYNICTSANNIGGHYNASTYIFTAPVAGRYFFTFNLLNHPTNQSQGEAYISVNNSGHVALARKYGLLAQQSLSTSCVVALSANDNVRVKGVAKFYASSQHASFSGYLLG